MWHDIQIAIKGEQDSNLVAVLETETVRFAAGLPYFQTLKFVLFHTFHT